MFTQLSFIIVFLSLNVWSIIGFWQLTCYRAPISSCGLFFSFAVVIYLFFIVLLSLSIQGHYTRTRSQTPSQIQCNRVFPLTNQRKARVRTVNHNSTGELGIIAQQQQQQHQQQSPLADSDKGKKNLLFYVFFTV